MLDQLTGGDITKYEYIFNLEAETVMVKRMMDIERAAVDFKTSEILSRQK